MSGGCASQVHSSQAFLLRVHDVVSSRQNAAIRAEWTGPRSGASGAPPGGGLIAPIGSTGRRTTFRLHAFPATYFNAATHPPRHPVCTFISQQPRDLSITPLSGFILPAPTDSTDYPRRTCCCNMRRRSPHSAMGLLMSLGLLLTLLAVVTSATFIDHVKKSPSYPKSPSSYKSPSPLRYPAVPYGRSPPPPPFW